MLSLFPQVLFLSPLAVTLLRIASALVFLSMAWTHLKRRKELGEVDFIVVGRGVWIPILTAVFELLIAGGLLFGIYTQAAALLGALGALKSFIWKRRYSMFLPTSRIASALLFVICVSLIFMGAGAFAFDLPL